MPEEQVWQRGGQAAVTATGGGAFGSSEQWKMRGGCFHTTTLFVPGSRVEAEISSETPVYKSTRYIPVYKIYTSLQDIYQYKIYSSLQDIYQSTRYIPEELNLSLNI
jgi:hypothetical protein